MTNGSARSSRTSPFDGRLDEEHRRVDPCFMTGKGCVYTSVIDKTLRDRKNATPRRYAGFSVMPFRKNLYVFFDSCLKPYFTAAHDGRMDLERADEVKRPGIIICEGICKRIQASDFVTVDVSLPNSNVFYELGLAFGMSHKILVLHHHEASFGKKMAEAFQDMDCRPFAYHDLDALDAPEGPDFEARTNIWRDERISFPSTDEAPRVLFYEQSLPDETTRFESTVGKANDDVSGIARLLLDLDLVRDTLRGGTDEREDIHLDFRTHVRSGIGRAIDAMVRNLYGPHTEPQIKVGPQKYDYQKIWLYREVIKGLREVVTVRPDAQFGDIKAQVDSSYCMIIRTGQKNCHPMAYFWLGYGHARGKHVVPVTVVKREEDGVSDLAFDIRAQRHMIFIQNSPDSFERELTTSMHQMINDDFSEWSRRRFWDRMLGKRGEVSIFTGALHAAAYDREMVGDWDLRAASELMSYFAKQQYQATIENPVYTPEYPETDRDDLASKYIAPLKQMMTDKNCILIASPDVNPLTEIVLGEMHGVPDTDLFKSPGTDALNDYPDAMVVFKELPPEENKDARPKTERFFYHESRELTDDNKTRRGFRSSQVKSGELTEPFASQHDQQEKAYTVYGHIVILSNPFREHDGNGELKFPGERYIIILNGVGGPATFALTHVLTGGVTKEFVSYPEEFDPQVNCESILRDLLDTIGMQQFESTEFIIDVTVGDGEPAGGEKGATSNITDWRRILRWTLNKKARRPPIKIMPKQVLANKTAAKNPHPNGGVPNPTDGERSQSVIDLSRPEGGGAVPSSTAGTSID
jgi:hypothetical protein